MLLRSSEVEQDPMGEPRVFDQRGVRELLKRAHVSMMKRIGITAVLAVVLHVLLGWAWTFVAGLVGGGMGPRRGWVVGALGVLLDWLLLVVYNGAVAASAVQEMARVFGALIGNLPGAAVVCATLLVGAVLGALGGALGSALRRVLFST